VKRIRILISVLLAVGLLMFAMPVYADDPPDGLDVDIGIIGDDANVDVNIDGDNPSVEINGQVPFVTYHSHSPSKWAKNTIKEDIFPWMEYTEGLVVLNMDGLAKVILLAQANEARLDEVAGIEQQFEAQDNTLIKVDADIGSLQNRISELESQNQEQSADIAYQLRYIASLQSSFNVWMLVLVICLAMVICLATTGGFCIYLFRKWRSQ